MRGIQVTMQPNGLLTVIFTKGATRPRDVEHEFHFGQTPEQALNLVGRELILVPDPPEQEGV